MKILIAAGIYPPDPGGPAVHAQAQYVGFRKLGQETRLVALAHYRRWPRGMRHALYFLSLVYKALSSEVVYAHDAAGVGLMALYAAKLTRKKLTVRIGGDIAWERAVERSRAALSMNEWYREGQHLNDPYFRVVRKVLKRADAVVVVSELLKDIYTQYYGIPEAKLHVIANPLLEKKEPTLPVGQKIIYASRLVVYKNLELVLKVMAKVLPHHPGTLFIIMGDGPDRAKLEALSQSLHISQQVIFKGTVPQAEVIENTRDSFLALAPALTEFNPNYVLQALSYGKPFLISRENGLPFRVPEEFVFDARDEEGLQTKLVNLLSEEGYAEAQESVRKIDFQMSWEEVIKQNEEVIKGLFIGV